MQRHGHLFGRQEIVAHRHREGQVQHQHRGGLHGGLGALDLEVVGRELHRRATAPTGARIAQGALDVEVEGIAELVGLGRVLALVADAGPLQVVAARPVAQEAAVEVAEGVLAEAADGPGRQAQLALVVVDEARLLEHPGQLGQALEALGRLVAQQVAHPVDVDLGERPGTRSPPQHLLQLVQVGQFLEQLHGLTHADRFLSGQVARLLPPHLRKQLAQVAAQLVHLPLQVHVPEQLLGQFLELGPLFGRHGVEHLLHRRHPSGHHLEQLVEGLRVLGEEIAEALHEPVEVGYLAGPVLFEHPVQLGEHVLHPGDVLG